MLLQPDDEDDSTKLKDDKKVYSIMVGKGGRDSCVEVEMVSSSTQILQQDEEDRVEMEKSNMWGSGFDGYLELMVRQEQRRSFLLNLHQQSGAACRLD